MRAAELVAQRIEKRPRLADQFKPLAPQRLVELSGVGDSLGRARAGERRQLRREQISRRLRDGEARPQVAAQVARRLPRGLDERSLAV
jgi:hypothetical protein